MQDDTKQAFEQLNRNVDTAFGQALPALQQGLRGALNDERATISTEAEKAAAEEQPRWKGILKVVLIIAVVVVVALVVGPFVIGAVGAAAGALGAGAAAGAIGAVVGGAIVGAGTSAVIQIGSNLIDGKHLLDGVVQAMVVGAIGGALGGLAGLAGQGLSSALTLGEGLAASALKFGVDMVFDTVGGVLGNVASGQPLTLEGIVQGFVSGLAVSLSLGALTKFGPIGKIQQGAKRAGESFGTNIGTRMASSVGFKSPAGAGADVNPGSPEHQTSDSDQTPAGRVGMLEKDPNTPGARAGTPEESPRALGARASTLDENAPTNTQTPGNQKTEYSLATGASKGMEPSETTIAFVPSIERGDQEWPPISSEEIG